MAPQPYRKRAKGKRHGPRNEKQREEERKRERKREKISVLAAIRPGERERSTKKKDIRRRGFEGQSRLDRAPAFRGPFDTE